MVAALATASRFGILIKNTRFLEALADIDSVVLDKTGTITLGRLELASIRPVNGFGERELLSHALSCAAGSRHPASRAIVRAAERAKIDVNMQSDRIEEVAGKGIVATCQEGSTLLGRRQWLVDEGFDVPGEPEHAGPVVWIGRFDRPDGNGHRDVIGCFLLADRPRPEAKQAIGELRELAVRRTVLLTGDRKAVADEIGRQLEMDQVIADVLPEQKLDVVYAERAAGNLVMVVGDGINDAPALAKSDVGVALGAAASDIALQSADVALMTSDLGRLPLAVRLARRTRSTIHQNVLVGAGSSIVFVWLASIGIIAPLVGAVLHNVGAALVIVNSARLLSFGQRDGRSVPAVKDGGS
jgi:Cd2+/Zn2+-exporting ATPase/Cu+-exporting ATPase